MKGIILASQGGFLVLPCGAHFKASGSDVWQAEVEIGGITRPFGPAFKSESDALALAMDAAFALANGTGSDVVWGDDDRPGFGDRA